MDGDLRLIIRCLPMSSAFACLFLDRLGIVRDTTTVDASSVDEASELASATLVSHRAELRTFEVWVDGRRVAQGARSATCEDESPYAPAPQLLFSP